MRRSALLLLASLAACSRGAAAPAPGSDGGATSAAPAASAPPPAPEPESPGKSLREATLKTSRAFDTARSLADEVGPRLSGSAGGKAAIGWGLKALSAAGLQNRHLEEGMVPH